MQKKPYTERQERGPSPGAPSPLHLLPSRHSRVLFFCSEQPYLIARVLLSWDGKGRAVLIRLALLLLAPSGWVAVRKEREALTIPPGLLQRSPRTPGEQVLGCSSLLCRGIWDSSPPLLPDGLTLPFGQREELCACCPALAL